MGVDCVIRLPADVRVQDAAEVVGILLGCPVKWVERVEREGFRWVEVEGVSVESYKTIPQCARILTPNREFMWHFEGQEGCRLLMPRSTPEMLALGRALVDFFGGVVDYQDCDTQGIDYQQPKPRPRNDPEDGEEWDAFQQAIFDLKPLTPEDVKRMRPFAAYKEVES